MNKSIFAGMAALATLAGGAALAQTVPAPAPMAGHSGQPGAQRMMTHSRSQVGAKVREHFTRLDSNRDGFLTQAEADAGRAMMHERMKAMTPADHNAMFDRIDSNRDGQVSRAEFAAAPMGGHERKADRGGRQAMMGMGLNGAMFTMADANKDSRVSLQEATDAAYRHFDMADTNRDGQLTPEERRNMMKAHRANKPS